MAQRLAVGDLAHGQIARNAMCQGYVIPLQLLTRPIVGCFRPHILGLPNEKRLCALAAYHATPGSHRQRTRARNSSNRLEDFEVKSRKRL